MNNDGSNPSDLSIYQINAGNRRFPTTIIHYSLAMIGFQADHLHQYASISPIDSYPVYVAGSITPSVTVPVVEPPPTME